MVVKEAPDSYTEAMQSEDIKEWFQAMEEELESLKTCKTWNLEKLPRHRKAIANRWVFVAKTNSKNEVIRYKARLVARGFTQQPRID